jgi:hypothetical protein
VITEVEKWMITLKYRAGLGREKTSKFRRILENFMRIIAPQM